MTSAQNRYRDSPSLLGLLIEWVLYVADAVLHVLVQSTGIVTVLHGQKYINLKKTNAPCFRS